MAAWSERVGYRRDDGVSLTARHVQVLRQAARGLTCREAAAETFHSENTVKYHRRELMERLEARTIAEAVAIAYREGILS